MKTKEEKPSLRARLAESRGYARACEELWAWVQDKSESEEPPLIEVLDEIARRRGSVRPR